MIESMKQTLLDRAMEILESLPVKQANLIAFVLDPYNTAYGAAFSYNREQVMDRLEKCLNDGIIEATRAFPPSRILESDVAHDMSKLCEMIENGNL